MIADTEKGKKYLGGLSLNACIGFALFIVLTLIFYFWLPAYREKSASAVYWWWDAMWANGNDYDHGWLVPILSTCILVKACRGMKGMAAAPSYHGLWMVLASAVFLVLGVRTQQGRIAVTALPILLTGAVWCFWGGRIAARCAFPFFLLWLSIPVPGFQQSTVWMQLLATQAAQWGAGLFGVQTVVEGTNIASATGGWDTYSVAGGCSGIRSLTALAMISVTWAYLASSLALWKRLLLALSAFPLAIIANAFRVASIFICAEYVNPAFATRTWHDWSGMMFFFPASLICLMLLHSLLAGEIPFFKRRRVVITRRGGTPAAGDAAPAAQGRKEVEP